MGREAGVDLVACGSEGRAVGVWNEVIDGQVVAAGLEPSQQGAFIEAAFGGVDCAEEGVLKNPVKQTGRSVPKKIDPQKLGGQVRGRRLARAFDGAGGEIA